MHLIQCDNVAFFDVDDTLVTTDYGPHQFDETIDVESHGISVKVIPIYRHIELLKQFKGRGFTVCVWSQGGWAWADAVIHTLELDEFVDLIICKPKWYVDDLPCQEFMGKRTYLLNEKEEG